MVVRHHREEATQHVRRNVAIESSDVSLDEHLDEVAAPHAALILSSGKKGAREPAPQPQVPPDITPDLGEAEAAHHDELDAPGERLRRPSHQVGRRAAQKEEPSGQRFSVEEHPEHREQLRHALHLVRHDHPLKALQDQLGAGETGSIRRILEVEKLARMVGSNVASKGRLTALSRAKKNCCSTPP